MAKYYNYGGENIDNRSYHRSWYWRSLKQEWQPGASVESVLHLGKPIPDLAVILLGVPLC